MEGRLAIIGFAIPVAIGLTNGLHGVLPNIPRIVTDYDLTYTLLRSRGTLWEVGRFASMR